MENFTPPATAIPPAKVDEALVEVMFKRFAWMFPTKVEVAVVDPTQSAPLKVEVPVEVAVNIPTSSMPMEEDAVVNCFETWRLVEVALVLVELVEISPPDTVRMELVVSVVRKLAESNVFAPE